MSDVAAYHVFVCALFPVQGGMELYVLPDDDMRCAIETCRSSEIVLV
jgi:hypothetical protein